MNNEEIKEIYLSNLEWTKTHDNMGGVIGNVIFKDNISYEEYEKLLKSGYFILCNKDYITNLQEENKGLYIRIKTIKRRRKKQSAKIRKYIEEISRQQKSNTTYKSRIDKAYETTTQFENWLQDSDMVDRTTFIDLITQIKNNLKGSDEE